MQRLFGPNSTWGSAVGGPEIKLHLRPHADRPDPFQLLDGYGQHFLFLPVDVRARAQCKHGMSVHAQSLIKTNLQVLPIEDTEKAKLLPMKSPLLRLRLVVHWIEQLNSHWFVGGRAMVDVSV
jgi:hypothetical protein